MAGLQNPIPQDVGLHDWIKNNLEDPAPQGPRPLPTGLPVVKPDRRAAPVELLIPLRGDNDPGATGAAPPIGQTDDDRPEANYASNGALRFRRNGCPKGKAEARWSHGDPIP